MNFFSISDIENLTGIKADVVYINGVLQPPPPHSQLHYIVTVSAQYLDPDVMKEEYNLDEEKGDYEPTGKPNEYRMALTAVAKDKMLKNGFAKSVLLDYSYNGGGGDVYPYDTLHKWSRDNFGPVQIPKKGGAITLTPENISVYERAIRVYENNKVDLRNGKIYVNDKETNQYVFKMNYYWMMGDNRQDSQDSRFWGFVPEDHVVGEAWLIWMSWDSGIRWKRMFNTIR